MNTNAVWSALRRFWRPAPQVPVREVDDTRITGEAAIRSVFQRLARGNTLMSLRSEEAGFNGLAKLLSAGQAGLTLQLHARGGALPDSMPPVAHATICSDVGVLQFSVAGATLDSHSAAVHMPYPLQIRQVQSRRHYRVTALSGAKYRAALQVPDLDKPLRLRNLSEEGVAFETVGQDLADGALIHDAVLELDGEPMEVSVLRVVHCRRFGDHCTIGAHFEIGVPDRARHLRRWIAAAQSATLSKVTDP